MSAALRPTDTDPPALGPGLPQHKRIPTQDRTSLTINRTDESRLCISTRDKHTRQAQTTPTTHKLRQRSEQRTGQPTGTRPRAGVWWYYRPVTDGTVNRHEHDQTGRLGMLEISKHNTNYHTYNIYGPSGDKHDKQYNIYNYLDSMLEGKKHNHNIIEGDLNLTTDRTDKTSKIRRQKERERLKTLNKITRQHNLTDTYREIYPFGKEVSFLSHKGRGTRLDRFLASNSIPATSIRHIQSTLKFTDHKAEHVQYGTPETQKTTKVHTGSSTTPF